MNAKILILVLLTVSFLFFGCAKKASESEGNVTNVTIEEQDQNQQEIDGSDASGIVVDNEEVNGEDSDQDGSGSSNTSDVDEINEDEVDEEDSDQQETNDSDIVPDDQDNTETLSEEDQELADLFQVDTNKPLEDEGFGVDTPSSD